jgi:hypothetical protein
MKRSAGRAACLFAVVALGACAGSTDQPTGAGGSAAGGVNGTAGTTGSAGTIGSAGNGGSGGSMTGDAGTTGSGGSATGSAGSGAAGSTTGVAGSIAGGGGSATGRGGASGGSTGGGAAGRGGASGGSTGGGSAGRGGAGGSSAGSGGNSGGATARGGSGGGAAGVTGGGGMGGCTISAMSTMGTIPTVGIVTFTTNATGITEGKIQFGPMATGPTMTAPIDLMAASYRTLLLGMKGSSMYVYRIVLTSPAGTCTSQDYSIMTGAVPSSVPKPTTTIMNAAAHAKGFMVTSSGVSGTGAWIYDSDGAPVWWATGPSGTSRIQMSWDGSKMYMMSLNVQNSGAGSVRTVAMDGSGAATISGMQASHHDMTAIPGGFATVLWNSSGIDAPCSLVERMDNATTNTVIIANLNSVYNSNSYHTNSIHYYPADNTYTLGDRNPNLYVKVTRAGALLWQFGGTNPKDASKNISGAGTWTVNHGHHLLADGTFILFNNGAMSGGQSVAKVFKINETARTATSSLNYMSGVNSNVMGDAQFLPNGNLLVTYSQSGQINEVTASGQVVATFKGSAFGYTEFRESLYGPPPR